MEVSIILSLQLSSVGILDTIFFHFYIKSDGYLSGLCFVHIFTKAQGLCLQGVMSKDFCLEGVLSGEVYVWRGFCPRGLCL